MSARRLRAVRHSFRGAALFPCGGLGRSCRESSDALLGTTSALWVEGRWDEAIDIAAATIFLSRGMGLRRQALTALNVLALVQRFRGDVDAAIQTGQLAPALSEELGEIWLRGSILDFLAAATLRVGRTDEAEKVALRGLDIRRDLDHAHGLGSLLDVLANVEVARGDDGRAATLLGGAASIWQSISWQHTVPNQRDHDQVRTEGPGSTGRGTLRSPVRGGSRHGPRRGRRVRAGRRLGAARKQDETRCASESRSRVTSDSLAACQSDTTAATTAHAGDARRWVPREESVRRVRDSAMPADPGALLDIVTSGE